MTDSKETNPTTKKRIPEWVFTAATVLLVLGAIQVPKIWRALEAGMDGGVHVCQLIYDGQAVEDAFESMRGDERFNYPKQYEYLAQQMLFFELETCPPWKRLMEAQS